MTALDDCEPQMIESFDKAGWKVFEKPYYIQVLSRNFKADVSFEREVDGQTETIIVVEVKCFSDPILDTPEFYRAIGQYQLYRNAMRFNHIDLPLYLAIPLEAYQRFQKRPELMLTLETERIDHIIVDLTQLEVVQWIRSTQL